MAADADALRRWSVLHDGYDVDSSALVRGWLRFVHLLARPLARHGVPATAVTVAGVCTAGAAVCSPPSLATALVLATAVCDGVDGAVAVQHAAGGRAVGRHGALIDHAADRASDVLFAAALARAGAPVRLASAAAVATWTYEAGRALARRTGRGGAVVTMGERPMRVAAVAIGIVVAPSVAAGTLLALTSGSIVQLARAVVAPPPMRERATSSASD